ncbi:MAG: molybdopterin converting factor subunit 1 [Proteobacteria bacterium]|nr:molybdopterin converting factor subunit 1 [Pseudomonadota bacterium]MDA1331928.1 molybdopterin converting factor subunit 1 [Pseudomonadota bacterium]
MEIKILFFAKLRETFKVSQEVIVLADVENKVSDVLNLLRQRGDVWRRELDERKSFRIAVNQEMVSDDVFLNEADEMALFPPVTGG